MISTIFDFDVSEEEFIIVKASAKKIGKWADDLVIKLPKGLVVTPAIYYDIQEKAVEELRKVQNSD